jgi:5,5'-dehydrodivanillate O-demethylase
MLSSEENVELTSVAAGTAMGELLRRYWHPIAAAGELDRRPTKEVTLLGEELVLYKDRSGRLGLIGRRCAHRRVSLVYGVPEQDGLRCQYHGWKFDETGRCLEAPFEDTVNPEARFRDRIRLPGYPVQELAGLIFAYLGPDPAPLLPRWAPLTWQESVHDVAITILPCNWLQCQENSLDPVHAEWLHGNYATWVREQMGDDEATMAEFRRRVRSPHLKIAFNEFKYGIIKRRLVQGADETHDDWATGHPVFFPNILLVGTPEQTTLQWRVPIDQTHTFHVSLYTWHAASGRTAPRQAQIPYRYVELLDENNEFAHQTLTFNQDYMSWSTQGPLAERDHEKLGESDKGIILFRRQLKQQMDLVSDGGQPMNVFREPGSNFVTDIPLEHVKHGGKTALHPRIYVPGEGGYSDGANDIERVLATYLEPEPQPVS